MDKSSACHFQNPNWHDVLLRFSFGQNSGQALKLMYIFTYILYYICEFPLLLPNVQCKGHRCHFANILHTVAWSIWPLCCQSGQRVAIWNKFTTKRLAWTLKMSWQFVYSTHHTSFPWAVLSSNILQVRQRASGSQAHYSKPFFCSQTLFFAVECLIFS